MDRLQDHEQRIRALEDFVRGFKSSFGTGPSGSGSGAVTVPKTTVSTLQRKPNTYAIFNIDAPQETLTKMTNIIKNTMTKWTDTEPEGASVVFVIVYGAGGRLNLATYNQIGGKFKGARVIGISFTPGQVPLKWPNDAAPVSLSLNMLLADDFVSPDLKKAATAAAIERLAQEARAGFQDLQPIGCAFCSNDAPPRQCANQCGALYCGQSCADADWIKGHAATCNKIGGNVDKAKPKPPVMSEQEKIWVDWANAAPHFNRQQLDVLAASGHIVADFSDSTPQDIKDFFEQHLGFVITERQADRIRRAGIKADRIRRAGI